MLVKASVVGVFMLLATVAAAQTQPPPDSAAQGGPGIRAGHITATGETVPNPGASQSGGTTPLDLGVQRKDREIDESICKGC